MDSVERVCDLLVQNGFDYGVVDAFRKNKIDWDVFAQLDRDDIQELGVTALGNRKKLVQLIAKLQNSGGVTEKEALTANEKPDATPESHLPSIASRRGSCSKVGETNTLRVRIQFVYYHWNILLHMQAAVSDDVIFNETLDETASSGGSDDTGLPDGQKEPKG